MVRKKNKNDGANKKGIAQKHLGTILSFQILFSIIFGGLAFWAFNELSDNIIATIFTISGNTLNITNAFLPVIIATKAFIIVTFIAVYTV